MKRFLGLLLRQYGDDLLLILGCGCILYGLAMWSIPITWITGGLMLAGFGVLIGKAKAKNAAE